MALITLTGDSDGDLHTADLHNSKFGAIASVLNGNVDLDNLAKPKSTGIIRFNLNGYHDSNTDGHNEFYQLTSATAGNINGLGFLASTNADNVIKSTWFKCPIALSLQNCKVIYSTSAYGNSGQNFNVYVQVSSSTTITDSYTTIGTFTNDFNGSVSINEETVSLSSTAVGANYYMRVVVENPSTFTLGEPPPGFEITLQYKTDHVA
jgi:hypothetical protein